MDIASPSNGKGSGRRPTDVPQKQVDENWNTIFGKKKPEKEKKWRIFVWLFGTLKVLNRIS